MVSSRTAVAIAAPFAIAYAWCVAATVIFCAGIRHPEFLAYSLSAVVPKPPPCSA